MKFLKYFCLSLTILFFVSVPVIAAESGSFIVPVTEASQLDNLYLSATDSASPVTLSVDINILKNATFSAGLKNIYTVSLPNLINLLPLDRQQIIDQTFSLFRERFGFFPRAVVSPYLDSFSLQYLSEHYSVIAAVIDDYGQSKYGSYYPSNQNTLIPAQTVKHRLKIVIYPPQTLLPSGLNLIQAADIYQQDHPLVSLLKSADLPPEVYTEEFRQSQNLNSFFKPYFPENVKTLPFSTPPLIFIFNLLKIFGLLLAVYFVIKKFKFDFAFGLLPLTLIFFGSLIWFITIFRSGSLTLYGLSFWGPHGHDAFVHLALIESFKRSLWPLINPTLVNQTVVNYHFLYDYILAILSRFLNIPSLDLYFRYLPPIMAVSIGLLSANLMKKWLFSQNAIRVSLICLYFAGSFGFFVGGGESTFWSAQAISTLINPPFAFSLCLLLLWLNLFTEKLSWKRILVLSLLGGLLIQVKSYSAVLLLGALFVNIFSPLLTKERVRVRSFILFLLTLLFTVLFFLPTYQKSQNLFVFSPLWFIKSLVSSPDRLYSPRFAAALNNYPLSGQIFKFVVLELLLTLVFFVGNLGIRLFSLPFIFKNFSKFNLSQKITLTLILLGAVLPLLIIQTANPWNTIQFFYYSLFFLSLFTGPALVEFIYSLKNLKTFIPVILLLVVVLFSTTYLTLKDYLSPIPASYIGFSELTQLHLLSQKPTGLVLSPEFNLPLSRSYVSPKPVFAYTSTAYISALSGQPSYLADEINLLISNYNFKNQSQTQKQFYRSRFPEPPNQVKYILTNPQFDLKKTDNLNLDFDSPYYKTYTLK